MYIRAGAAGLCLLWLAAWPARATAAPSIPATASVCPTIAAAATRYRLPLAYFTRLIWQESRFDPDAQSPAGAQGVAQFMPRTAAGRGLANPFAPAEAIDQSAAYLDELRHAFGNLGLAAAAYNAGPGRLARWLAGKTDLPEETLDYVEIVTGHSIEDWRVAKVPDIDTAGMFSCPRIADLARTLAPRASGRASGKAWAVILVGSPRREIALAEYQLVRNQFSKVLGSVEPSVVHKRIGGLEVARFIVQIEQDARSGANDLCVRLKRAGGNCIVLANRR